MRNKLLFHHINNGIVGGNKIAVFDKFAEKGQIMRI
jgi:hypothetical protein